MLPHQWCTLGTLLVRVIYSPDFVYILDINLALTKLDYWRHHKLVGSGRLTGWVFGLWSAGLVGSQKLDPWTCLSQIALICICLFIKGKGKSFKGKGEPVSIAPCRDHTSKALRHGTRSQGISQFYLHTPRSYTNRMNQNHTCHCFPAEAGTHLPTPEGWKAELALGG